MLVAVNDLKRVLVFIKDARFAYLMNGFIKPTAQEKAGLRPSQLLTMAMFDWLAYTGCIDTDQQMTVVEQFADEISSVAQKGIPPKTTAVSPSLIKIGDCRFVAGTLTDRWYDLHECVWIDCLPHPVVTWLACDLVAMAGRLGDKLGGRGEDKDAQREYFTGTDVAGEVCPGGAER